MQVHERALARGRGLGLSREQVEEMADLAAPFTHPFGNCRYEDYWFLLLDQTVLAMGRITAGGYEARVTFPDAINCTFCGGAMRSVVVDDDDGSEEIVPCPRMSDRTLPLCDRS